MINPGHCLFFTDLCGFKYKRGIQRFKQLETVISRKFTLLNKVRFQMHCQHLKKTNTALYQTKCYMCYTTGPLVAYLKGLVT